MVFLHFYFFPISSSILSRLHTHVNSLSVFYMVKGDCNYIFFCSCWLLDYSPVQPCFQMWEGLFMGDIIWYVRALCCRHFTFSPFIKTTVNTGRSCDQCWLLICCFSWTLLLVLQPCHAGSWETACKLNKGFLGRVVPVLLRLCALCLSAVWERKGVISSWAHSRFNQTALASSGKKDHCQDEFDVNARDVGKQNRLSDTLCGHLCSPGMKTGRTSGWQ